jgi:hypothetical protein
VKLRWFRIQLEQLICRDDELSAKGCWGAAVDCAVIPTSAAFVEGKHRLHSIYEVWAGITVYEDGDLSEGNKAAVGLPGVVDGDSISRDNWVAGYAVGLA